MLAGLWICCGLRVLTAQRAAAPDRSNKIQGEVWGLRSAHLGKLLAQSMLQVDEGADGALPLGLGYC